MTEDQKIDYELNERELATRLLGSFTTYTMPDYEMTATQGGKKIHKQIIEVLEAVERGEKKRVMIFCPPRLGKSELVSKRFPTWYLGKHPKDKVVLASYGADLASGFGRKSRDIVLSQEYKNIFPNLRLSKTKSESSNWETVEGGGMYTVGRGGALTGEGGNILIIDDIVKDREEAESETIQNKTIEWYTSTFRTRKQTQDTAIIIMMTRWNRNDLAGFLLEQANDGGEQWDVLIIQGIDEKTGEEIVWPGKWNKGYMELEKANMFVKDWAALFQQDPIASGSNIFNMHDLRYFNLSDFEVNLGILKKEDIKPIIFIDPAFSSDKKSDDAVVGGIGRHIISGQYYFLDCYADTSAPSKTYLAVINMIDRLGMDGFKIDDIYIEDVPINKKQTEFIKGLKSFLATKGRYYNIIPIKPVVNKEDRIKFVLEPKISMNIVHIRKDMIDETIVKKLETQLRDFPNSKKDDIIDTLGQGIDVLDKGSNIQNTSTSSNRRTDDHS